MDIICPHCRITLDVPGEYAGESVDCPSCRKSFRVPSAPKRTAIRLTPKPIPPRQRASDRLDKCPDCGHAVSRSASRCPGCGRGQTNRASCLGLVLGVLVLTIFCLSLYFGGCSGL